MRQPPPSYLDPNNVLTAWGSSEAQLGLQVLPMLPFCGGLCSWVTG